MRRVELPLREQARDPVAFWRDAVDGACVGFAGRGLELDRADAPARLERRPLASAWLRQVHSAAVRPGRPGDCGEGDALASAARELALLVATADCVPVLLASASGVAAVHAGWRGLAAGVIAAAAAALPGGAEGAVAWIGPAIGPCCYEVGEEVAVAVAAASDRSCLRPRAGRRPHLDLAGAAAQQLECAGIAELRQLALCTRCERHRLWSYRAEHGGQGRNYAWIFRPAQNES